MRYAYSILLAVLLGAALVAAYTCWKGNDGIAKNPPQSWSTNPPQTP